MPAPLGKTAADRLLARVEKTETCWLWTGGHQPEPRDYGTASYRGRVVPAHRAFYMEFVGAIPDGLNVCHRCDTPRCVNPAHLFLGTTKENQRDSVTKGRQWHVRKTHCKHGHPFSGDNLIVSKQGRRCRACKAASHQRRKAA